MYTESYCREYLGRQGNDGSQVASQCLSFFPNISAEEINYQSMDSDNGGFFGNLLQQSVANIDKILGGVAQIRASKNAETFIGTQQFTSPNNLNTTSNDRNKMLVPILIGAVALIVVLFFVFRKR